MTFYIGSCYFRIYEHLISEPKLPVYTFFLCQVGTLYFIFNYWYKLNSYLCFRFTYLKIRQSLIIVGHMSSVTLKITITPQSVIMNTTQNAIDANFSQNYFVKLGQLLVVLTVAQKNETRWSMKSHSQNAVRD